MSVGMCILACCCCLLITAGLVVLIVLVVDNQHPQPVNNATVCGFSTDPQLQPVDTLQPITVQCGAKPLGVCIPSTNASASINCEIDLFFSTGFADGEGDECVILSSECINGACSCPDLVLCERNVSQPSSAVASFKEAASTIVVPTLFSCTVPTVCDFFVDLPTNQQPELDDDDGDDGQCVDSLGTCTPATSGDVACVVPPLVTTSFSTLPISQAGFNCTLPASLCNADGTCSCPEQQVCARDVQTNGSVTPVLFACSLPPQPPLVPPPAPICNFFTEDDLQPAEIVQFEQVRCNTTALGLCGGLFNATERRCDFALAETGPSTVPLNKTFCTLPLSACDPGQPCSCPDFTVCQRVIAPPGATTETTTNFICTAPPTDFVCPQFTDVLLSDQPIVQECQPQLIGNCTPAGGSQTVTCTAITFAKNSTFASRVAIVTKFDVPNPNCLPSDSPGGPGGPGGTCGTASDGRTCTREFLGKLFQFDCDPVASTPSPTTSASGRKRKQ